MNGGWSSFNINVIEIFETIDRIGLSLKESFWMIHYGELCINERLPINDLTITLEDGYELSTVGQKIVDVFPISVDWDISRWIRNTNSGDCVCGGSYDNFDYHTKHDDVHLEYLMSLSVQCECGVKFFYNTQYPHFREKEHKNWIDGDKSKYNLVKLICKCGKIINYSDRVEHNKTH